jgi:hypothetical protein
MTKRKNQAKKSGQLARQSQSSNAMKSSLGQPVMAAPVAYSSPTQNNRPQITNGAKSSRIVHRELVSTISGTTSFGSVAFSLNPGLAATFPWLSTVASSYEQYHFRKLRFHYVTRTSTATTGSILLAPEYDPADTVPSTEVDLAMMAGAREDVSWRDIVIDFVVADMFPMGPRKFTRSGSLASNLDIKTYDAGQLIVGTTDFANTNAVGKLWVEYDIDLFVPQNPGASAAAATGGAVSAYTITSNQSVSTGVAEIIAWDAAYYDVLGLTNNSGALTLPTGAYFVTAIVNSEGMTGSTFSDELEILIDSSSTTPALKQKCVLAVSGVGNHPLCVQGVVVSTGSNVLSINYELTATGTLIVPANFASLTVMKIA